MPIFFVVLKNPHFSVTKWPRTIGLFRQSSGIRALVLSERWRWIFSHEKAIFKFKAAKHKVHVCVIQGHGSFWVSGRRHSILAAVPYCTLLACPKQSLFFIWSDHTHTHRHTQTNMHALTNTVTAASDSTSVCLILIREGDWSTCWWHQRWGEGPVHTHTHTHGLRTELC